MQSQFCSAVVPPLPWPLTSSKRGSMMVLLRLEGDRTAEVYMRGSDCTTTGMRCTWLASFPAPGRLRGLDGGGGTECRMCKYGWPLTPLPGGTRGPDVSTDEAEVMTEGEEEEDDDDDDKEDGEKAYLRGEEDKAVVGVVDEEDGRGLLIDRSTGSVCMWKCRSWTSRSSGVSALTLLRKKGTPSIAEKGRTLGDCGRKKERKMIKMELNKPTVCTMNL